MAIAEKSRVLTSNFYLFLSSSHYMCKDLSKCVLPQGKLSCLNWKKKHYKEQVLSSIYQF